MTAQDPMSDFSETGSSEIVCPGRAAAHRLRQFERSWTSSSITSASGTRHPILKLSIDDLHISHILGHGAFSTVRQAYIRNTTTGHFDSERVFAVKRLKPHVIANEHSLKVAASDFALETKILSSLKHENIIKLHGIKDGDMIESLKEGSFFLVTDLLVETLKVRLARWAKKSLFRKRSGIPTTIKRLKEVAMGIANGMAYLHAKRIMYRDLKPANIGFDSQGTVKIFDFGLSRECNENSVEFNGENYVAPRLMTGGAGTPRYMAPEVARMERSYGFPADVYSFAILLWQIITDRVPYASIGSGVEFTTRVINGNVRPKLKYVDSDLLKKLLTAGWASEPERRPTFSLIVKVLKKEIEMNPSFCKQSSKREIMKAKRRSTMNPGSLIRAFKRLGQSDVADERTIGPSLFDSRNSLTDSSSTMPPSKLDLLRQRKNAMAKAGLTLVAQTSQRSLSESLSRDPKEDRTLLNDNRSSIWSYHNFTRAGQKKRNSKRESFVCN